MFEPHELHDIHRLLRQINETLEGQQITMTQISDATDHLTADIAALSSKVDEAVAAITDESAAEAAAVAAVNAADAAVNAETAKLTAALPAPAPVEAPPADPASADAAPAA